MQSELTEKQQHQLEHVKSAMASGLTFIDYAKKNNLDVKALYNWKCALISKKHLPGKTKKPFAKVATAPEKPLAATPRQVVTAFLPNGIELRFDAFTKDMLTLFKAL